VQGRTNAAASHPQQLVLGLDQPHELLIVVTDQLHGATFLRHLLQARPKIIVDVRFAPHFNFTAIGSVTVKQQIEEIGARYIRYAIPFHEYGPSLLRHDPMSIAIKLSDFVRESGNSQWPIMLLLKESVTANAFAPFLVGALSKYVGGNWMTEIVT
jgi:hypothetical protein